MYALYPKDPGGLGVSDFCKYYPAAQEMQLYQLYYCGSVPIDLLMWLPSKSHKAILYLFLSQSLHLWDTSCVLYLVWSCHTLVAPLFNNAKFPPGLHCFQFQWWIDKGLYRIGHFWPKRYLRDFLFFSIFKNATVWIILLMSITHFLIVLKKWADGITMQTVFESRCLQSTSQRGEITSLYTESYLWPLPLNLRIGWLGK